jgi:hypothetical protein
MWIPTRDSHPPLVSYTVLGHHLYLYAHASFCASAAPEIYGHDDVKKALLLQLVGGSTRYVVRTATEHVCV